MWQMFLLINKKKPTIFKQLQLRTFTPPPQKKKINKINKNK